MPALPPQLRPDCTRPPKEPWPGRLDGLTDLYAVRIGVDGFHSVSTVGGQLVQTWIPDFTTACAVKTGEVEMGPVAVALKATKAAAVLRSVRVR